MALLDLSLVTQTLVNLLKVHISKSTAWALPAPDVLPFPPDQIASSPSNEVLGIYLFHIHEDPYFKSQPPVGASSPPIRYTPMGLTLYYQVTAHSKAVGADATYHEQRLLGCALKALHDFPSLSDTSSYAGTVFFPVDLQHKENRIRIALEPIEFKEAMSFWTSASGPPRLSAFYSASVVMLEPDVPDARAGIVLQYGVDTFVRGAPYLDGSESETDIPRPAQPTITIRSRPAQVAPAWVDALGVVRGGRVTFTGSGLTGDTVSLLLRSQTWLDRVEVDPGWAVSTTGDSVLAAVRQSAAGKTTLPGTYSASIRIGIKEKLPDGSTRMLMQSSNETPFSILPRIDSVTALGGGIFKIVGFVFQDADLKDGALEVFVGSTKLAPSSAATPAAGEYVVSAADTMQVRLPASAVSGRYEPLRILVLGAESLPTWVLVP